jgi:hypothetical protein
MISHWFRVCRSDGHGEADMQGSRTVRVSGTREDVCSSSFAIRIRQFKLEIHRGHSSVGRAPALQAGSQGFESPCLHFKSAI